MYAIQHIHQVGSESERRIYPPRPLRRFHSGYVGALHTTHVDLWRITIRSSGVDLNCVANLIAIHRLREMHLELDGFIRGHTIVVPREKLGDDWCGWYILGLWNKCFVAPGSKCDIGKATGEWLKGIVH